MDSPEILRLALHVAHFVGLAAIVGPFLVQLRRHDGVLLTPMLVGASVQGTIMSPTDRPSVAGSLLPRRVR